MIKQMPMIGTAHALFYVALGLFFVFRDARPVGVVYTTMYVSGAELLWRGSEAAVFWEYGKYSCILLLSVALVRYKRLNRADFRPLFAFLLLTPSILLVPFNRQAISFNLSGALTLAIACTFFSTIYIGREELKKIFLFGMAPIVSLASLAANSTFQANLTTLVAGTKSTTAGIGPNQVSSVLGLGILFAFLSLFLWSPRERLIRALLMALVLGFSYQALISLSRGGVWNAAGAIIIASLYLFRSRKDRTRILVSAGVLAIILQFVVLPTLNRSTDGFIAERFSDTNSSGRVEIVKADLLAWRDHPILGTGPGGTSAYHAITFIFSPSHTEYSRLVGEHGVLGLVCMLILVVVVKDRWKRPESHLEKAIALALLAWAFLFFWHAATRLSAPSVAFGLAMAQLGLSETRGRRPATQGSGPHSIRPSL
jgi:O-antigen ligase